MSEHIVGVNPKEYNGRVYKSTLEAHTAETLDKLGIPWEYEPKTLTIQEGFYCPWQKRKVLDIEYIPDFVIGPIMIETKGFETPDWKIKKKLFFKYLKENDPDAIWYMVKNDKQLLQALDRHLTYLGYAVQVTSKPTRKQPSQTKLYDSIAEAMSELGMQTKSPVSILRSLTGQREYVYGYNWKLIKIEL